MRNRTRQKQLVEQFFRTIYGAASAGDILSDLPVVAKDRAKQKALVLALRRINTRVNALDRQLKRIAKAVDRLSVDETRSPTGLAAKIWP